MINLLAQQYCKVIQQPIVADPTSRFLKFRRPDIYAQIDRSKYTEEDFIRIDKLTYGSHVRLQFICPVDPCGCHKWESPIFTRVCDNSGCPFYLKGAGKTCRHQSFINNHILASEYAWDLNIGIDPLEISHYSHKELWFRCQKHKTCNQHIWKSTVANCSNGNSNRCPWCSIPCKQVCLCNSFMNNPLLKLLSQEFDKEKNIGIDPYKLSKGSHEYVWWKCFLCSFSWQSLLYHRTAGSGCPQCATKRNVENI